MKYAVLGAAGQLGRDLCPQLPGEVVPLTRAQADLTQPEALRTALGALRPDVVVNCAAYNFVDRAESEPEAAFAVNAWGVKALAEICRRADFSLIQLVTPTTPRDRARRIADSDGLHLLHLGDGHYR